jgi:hypothetical protein
MLLEHQGYSFHSHHFQYCFALRDYQILLRGFLYPGRVSCNLHPGDILKDGTQDPGELYQQGRFKEGLILDLIIRFMRWKRKFLEGVKKGLTKTKVKDRLHTMKISCEMRNVRIAN